MSTFGEENNIISCPIASYLYRKLQEDIISPTVGTPYLIEENPVCYRFLHVVNIYHSHYEKEKDLSATFLDVTEVDHSMSFFPLIMFHGDESKMIIELYNDGIKKLY